MRNLTLILASCFAVLMPSMASASHGLIGIPNSYGGQYHQQYQPAYPTPLYFPLFSRSYQPETSPDSLAQLDKLERIAAALEKMAASSPAAAAQAADLRHVQVLRANCSSCHNSTLKKGGLSLFDAQGQAMELTPELMTKILDRLSRPATDPERMPPRGRLSYDDLADVTQGLLRSSIKQ